MNANGSLIEKQKRREAYVGTIGQSYRESGLAGVGYLQESPTMEITQLIQEKGSVVSYSSPHVPAFLKIRQTRFNLESMAVNKTTLPHLNELLVCTDQDPVRRHGKAAIDTPWRYRRNRSENLRHA